MADLFAQETDTADRNHALNRPLADRMRPDSLDSFFGQEHLLKRIVKASLSMYYKHSFLFHLDMVHTLQVRVRQHHGGSHFIAGIPQH